MGKIDTDYLWLHEQQPPAGSRLRRLALLLVIPLIGGTAWLTATPQSALFDTTVTNAADANYESSSKVANTDVDASIGPGRADVSMPANAAQTDGAQDDPQQDSDIALSDSQPGAAAVAVAPIDPDREIDEPDSQAANSQAEPSHIVESSTGLAAASDAPIVDVPQDTASQWREVTIRSGDTLSIAFNRNDLSYTDSLKIAHMPEHGKRFTRGLRAGDTMRVKADDQGSVLAVDFAIDPLHTLKVRPAGDGFSGDMQLTDVEHHNAYAAGTIDTSFYVDALESGLSDRQIMELVKIFGWDIDFALDTRPGDRFVVVYDELYKDGDKVADGEILAASFINRGREVRAVRYAEAGDDQGTVYYSPEGRAMKKAFIRTPVDYTRISSGFNLSRNHPILNRIRRHEGTDYAAPTGTPIKATGSGRIVFRGRRGGYGNMIMIRHDSHLSTRYGHMSSFANKFGVGSKVRQGDVIGYVGMSGLATGPHLHYEFRVDGDPKDPERVELPKALPLPDEHLADFRKRSAPLLTQLDSLTRTDVARASTDDDNSAN
ncbi:Peptidase, M23/M37 family protein [Salinisphaera dokdonensis CL-ES53]|uniref:Peptidase, M23/M37 family protein n=1 Tax=Salinisphaera dokdonensis CL-ES53 TaxID=1304272 RepID=A0ABV2B0Q1_9GAMM